MYVVAEPGRRLCTATAATTSSATRRLGSQDGSGGQHADGRGDGKDHDEGAGDQQRLVVVADRRDGEFDQAAGRDLDDALGDCDHGRDPLMEQPARDLGRSQPGADGHDAEQRAPSTPGLHASRVPYVANVPAPRACLDALPRVIEGGGASRSMPSDVASGLGLLA